MANKPKVSVVVTCKNEWPIIMSTLYSFYEELIHNDYPFELIVVDNRSTDNTPDILRDRMRRWVRHGILKVVEYKDRDANVTVRNVGARAATGDVVVLSDAHVSIRVGTIDGMVRGWQQKGGLWHSGIQIWSDSPHPDSKTGEITKCYGYSLKLKERFWGSLCTFIPPEIKSQKPRPAYLVPMASHCCLLAGREEYLDIGGYSENFRCYGGGEPYLDLKYWLFGKKVWIYPEGLVRHAFGINTSWPTSGQDKVLKEYVWVKGKGLQKELKKGDQHLHYSRGYSWNNEQKDFNFMMAAYCIGGYEWLQTNYAVWYKQRMGNERYLEDVKQLRREVLSEGADDRKFIESRQVMTLDELLIQDPWKDFNQAFVV
jgi:glycosyltransferase involved in cell wall biosynthesis